MELSLRQIKCVLTELLLVLMTLCIILLYPILFAFFLPILFYRYVVTRLAHLDPKVGKIVSGLGAIYLAHTPYTKPVTTIITYFTLTSKPEIDQVVRIFNERIFSKKLETEGRYVYPELAQKIVPKYGYNFFHTVDDFDIRNHVRYLNPDDPEKLVTRTEITTEVMRDLGRLPFNPNQSPWETIVIPNLIDEGDRTVKGMLLFRCHHGLLDGFSFLKVMRKLGVREWKGETGFTLPPSSFLEKCVQFLLVLLTGPYHLLNMSLFSGDRNEWVIRCIEEYTGSIRLKLGNPIPVERLKRVKNHFGVSLSSVIIGIMVGGVTKLMKKQRRDYCPSKIYVTMSYPFPGHPDDRLDNHWTVAKIPVSVYKNDIGKTLLNVDKEYRNLRFSVLPLVFFAMNNLVGCLPTPIIPPIEGMVTSTCLLSNFPGPQHRIDVFGYDVADFSAASNSMKGLGKI